MALNFVTQKEYQISNPPKGPIHCLSATPAGKEKQPPILIFTHGASGTITSPAMANFTNGFTPLHPIINFQGPMNLQARAAQFTAILTHHDLGGCNSLGGRSMGARAAVLSATEGTTHLVLASYPLHSGDKVRDEILVNIPANVKVLFASGDKDGMCDFARLEPVRARMRATSWMLKVKGADHGMSIKPKSATDPVGRLVGDVAARWLAESDDKATEGEVSWDVKSGKAVWSGWSSGQGKPKPESSSKSKTSSAPASAPVASSSTAPSKAPTPKTNKRKAVAAVESAPDTSKLRRSSRKRS